MRQLVAAVPNTVPSAGVTLPNTGAAVSRVTLGEVPAMLPDPSAAFTASVNEPSPPSG